MKLIIVAVSCLALAVVGGEEVPANAAASPEEAPSGARVDFKALNKYLVDKVRTDDSEANLARLESDVGQLEGGLKRAAQIFLELSGATECDQKVLATLEEAHQAGLSTKKTLWMLLSGDRTQQVIVGHLNRIIETCSLYIERSFVTKYFATPTAYIDVFSETYRQWRARSKSDKALVEAKGNGEEGDGDDDDIVDVDELHYWLETLSKADPLAEYKEPVGSLSHDSEPVLYQRNKERFDYAFERYLATPCRELTTTLGDLYDKSVVVAKMSDNSYRFVEASDIYKYFAWALGACKRVLKMRGAQKAALYAL